MEEKFYNNSDWILHIQKMEV